MDKQLKIMKLITIVSIIMLYQLSFSQSKKNTFVKFNGSSELSYDGYDYNVVNYSNFRPRYEPNIVRFMINANLKLGKHFSIPFGITVSNRTTTYNLPSLPQENAITYIQNPRNNIHIDPKYKWAKFHLGSQTPQYSSLTTGDIQIFGVGFEINPGKFILGMNYGKSQIAIEPNIILNVQGAYKQNIIAGRIGFGKIKGSKFVINIAKIKDDPNSVTTAPIGITPAEGISVSPLVEFKIFKKLTFKTETALSVFTQDILNTTNFLDPSISSINKLITINGTTLIDFGHTSSLEWKNKNFKLGGEIKYIGPGFYPTGYRNFEKDILDYKIKTGFKLFKKKMNFKGTFGIRTNNINNTHLSTSNRLIANLNLFAQITKNFTLNFSFANFGFKNNPQAGYPKVEMINNSYMISPSYRIKNKKLTHQINVNASLNQFKQFDVSVLDFVNTSSRTYSGNYRIKFNNKPLNIGFNTLYVNTKSDVLDLKILSYGITSGYKLFKKKLKPSLAINIINVENNSQVQNNRINARLKIKYKINKTTAVKFGYRFNNVRYGIIHPGAELNENRFQFSISKKF